MDEIKSILGPPSARSRATVAAEAAANPEAMAKRLFILTMLGLFFYVSAILLVLQGAG